MKAQTDAGYPYQKLGQRRSPRVHWLAFSHRLIDPVVFVLSIIPFGLAAYRHHPNAVLLWATIYLLFILTGPVLDGWNPQRGATWLRRLRTLWSWVGLFAVLGVYYWFVRGSSVEAASLLWPILVYAIYFILRIFPQIPFFPYFFFPLIVLPVYAALIGLSVPAESDRDLGIASAVWIFIVLLVITVHVRTWDYYAGRFEAFRELVRWAGSVDAKLEDIQPRLDELGKRLAFERLTVLKIIRQPITTNTAIIDTNELPKGADLQVYRCNHHVQVIAKYFPGIVAPANLPSWPLRLGLLGKAFRERQPILCDDVQAPGYREIFYNPPWADALFDTRSELVQPIFESPNGQIIGFIDLQSNQPNSLHRDRDYLAALAAAIAPLLVKERLGTLVAKLDELRAALTTLDHEREVFERVAQFAIDALDVDVITYYPLGFGNGWPQLPAWHLGAWFPARLNSSTFHREDAPPVSLVAKWDSAFVSNSRRDDRLLPAQLDKPASEYFILREEIYSTVFLPIGTKARRIGALFLNYREPHIFSPSTQLALEMLRQTVAPHLERTRQLNDIQEGFGQISFVLHDVVRDSIAPLAAILPHLKRLSDGIAQREWAIAQNHFDQLLEPLQQHIDYLKTASLKFDLAANKLLPNDLRLALHAASGVMAQRYAGRGMRTYIDDAVEELPRDLRHVIFSIATEAAHNAVRAGEATLVNVGIYRTDHQVKLEIQSDGKAWNPQMPAKAYSAYGINARLQLARNRLSAEFEWALEGRQLCVTIPLLPHTEGKDPYA